MLSVKQGDKVAIYDGRHLYVTQVKRISPCGHVITCINNVKFNSDGNLHGKSTLHGRTHTVDGDPIILEHVDTATAKANLRQWMSDWLLMMSPNYLSDSQLAKITEIAKPYIERMSKEFGMRAEP